MKTSEVIRTAMGHVEKGWTQGQLCDDDGNVCALGALGLAAGGTFYGHSLNHLPVGLDHSLFSPARRAVMNRCVDLGYFGIPDMNDSPLTTKQDMLNVMEKTALSLEEKGE